MKLPFRGNENHVGTMYAGSMWTLAECSGLPWCFSAFGEDVLERSLPVVAQFNIKFFKPVKCDLYIRHEWDSHDAYDLENKLLGDGKIKVWLKSKLVSKEGEEYAECEGLYIVIENPDSQLVHSTSYVSCGL